MRLLDGQSADGSSAWNVWPGGDGTFWVRLLSGSATVTLEISPQHDDYTSEGTTYGAVAAGTETTFTANGEGNFTLAAGYLVRATVSSSSSPVVDAGIRTIPRA